MFKAKYTENSFQNHLYYTLANFNSSQKYRELTWKSKQLVWKIDTTVTL